MLAGTGSGHPGCPVLDAGCPAPRPPALVRPAAGWDDGAMGTPRPAPEDRPADREPARLDRSPFARYAQRFDRPLDTVPDLLRGGADPVRTAAGLRVPAAAVRGPATFFADYSAPRAPRHVRLCGAAACRAASGGTHVAEVEAGLGVAVGSRSADGSVSIQEVRCLGYCYGGPAALDGDEPCAGADVSAQLQGLSPRRDPVAEVHSRSRTPVVTAGLLGAGEPWAVWPTVVSTGSPDAVLAEVAAAGLTGRGGAGFSTARKWRAARARPGPRVVVANGDEGDPGSYVDRLLMEGDPHRLLEGLALACFATGAATGIVFVRSEYPRAVERLRTALAQAQADGHLGPDVHGSGVDLHVRVAVGAGSYVSGEETALLNGLEGLRGVVRPRPPYPVDRGLSAGPRWSTTSRRSRRFPGSSSTAAPPTPPWARRDSPARWSCASPNGSRVRVPTRSNRASPCGGWSRTSAVDCARGRSCGRCRSVARWGASCPRRNSTPR